MAAALDFIPSIFNGPFVDLAPRSNKKKFIVRMKRVPEAVSFVPIPNNQPIKKVTPRKIAESPTHTYPFPTANIPDHNKTDTFFPLLSDKYL